MRNLGLRSVALAMVMVPVTADAQGSPPAVTTQVVKSAGAPRVSTRHWGPRQNGRWIAGWRAPGGWNSYRPVVRGYILPSYWINPGYYIGNYARYGFSAPAAGYGWSRYYDDAVLTDRDGRVYDSVHNVDWDRYDAYDEGEDYSDSYGYRDDGVRHEGEAPHHGKGGDVTGAVVGAVVGAVAGNVIAGKGDRLAGSLIGGGAGALAGAAIGKAEHSSHHGGHELSYDYGNGGRDGVTYNGRWTGTWTGHYEGQPTQVYQGSYDGRYEGSAPHWAHHGGRRPHVMHHGGPAYGYGYGWGAPMITTMTFQSAPIVTTTTTTTEYVTYAAAARKRPARRVWKPRPKARCTC